MSKDLTIPYVSSHAKTRYAQRSDLPKLTVHQVWEEAIPVGFPDDVEYGPKGKLHPPAGVVLLYGYDHHSDHKHVIRTVFKLATLEDEVDLNDDHLVVHDDCGYRYDPTGGDCRWCELGYTETSEE